jgi:SOS-response transcriptional repressor LexA
MATESEESSRYWCQQAEENSPSDFSLMLTLWAVEEVSKLPPSMVRDSAMLTLQIVEWDILSRAIKEGVVLSDI